MSSVTVTQCLTLAKTSSTHSRPERGPVDRIIMLESGSSVVTGRIHTQICIKSNDHITNQPR